MSITMFNCLYETTSSRAAKFSGIIDHTKISEVKNHMCDVLIQCSIVDRVTVTFLQQGQIYHKTGSYMVNIFLRGVKQIMNSYILLLNKAEEVVSTSLICVGTSFLDSEHMEFINIRLISSIHGLNGRNLGRCRR